MRIALFALLLPACVTPRTMSMLHVNSAPWVASRCSSAARDGFRGVDFADDAGNRLRLLPEPDGRVTAIAFPADGSEPARMGSCGTMQMPPSHLRIMGVPSYSGSASLDCHSETMAITGTIEFENCH